MPALSLAGRPDAVKPLRKCFTERAIVIDLAAMGGRPRCSRVPGQHRLADAAAQEHGHHSVARFVHSDFCPASILLGGECWGSRWHPG